MNPKVDAFLSAAQLWREEMKKLRAIALRCELTEELKWGKPCYTFRESNVVVIQGFKASCALLFCKGALLKDPKGLLEKPGENTQGARRIRFTSVREIAAVESTLKAYIQEAVAAEKAGLEVKFEKHPEPVPKELREKLAENPAVRAAFAALTPGRQRAYILYFTAAKQSKTRVARIEKCRSHILRGKGLND
jgi:uncharacterized protein YdeI (YjbR/CyaY-like superfamily)